MKIISSYILALVCSLVFSSLADVTVDKEVIGTLYTIVGIMFSIGMSLIVSCTFDQIKNKKIIHRLRIALHSIRERFVYAFILSTIMFLISVFTKEEKDYLSYLIRPIKNSFELKWSILICCVLLVTIIYFIINMISIQKLNEDISDSLESSE